MSNTNREIVQALRGVLAERGIINDHSDWSPRFVYFYAKKGRSAVLKQKLEQKSARVSHFNKQTISCVPLEEIDVNECPCAPPSGCTFKRSVGPIPEPVARYLEVDNIIGNTSVEYLEWGDFRDRLSSRIKAERYLPYWTLRNLGDGTYLYVYNFTQKYATITSVFEDPLDVFLYPDCEGNVDKCAQFLDFPFVIDEGYVPLVLEASYRILAEKIKSDDHNINQKDDVIPSPAPIK